MSTALHLNKLDGDWWFDLGISYQKTPYHEKYSRVFTAGLGLATLYLRF